MLEVLIIGEQLRRRVPGGIGTYLRGLLMGLESLGTGVTLTKSLLPNPVVTRAWDRGFLGPRRRGRAGLCEVIHAPSLAVPPRGRLPLTVMVHDLAWRHEPDAYPPRGRSWHEAALHRAIERADLLLAPSTATADDLLAAGANEGRVEVVEEGCDHLPDPDEAGAKQLLHSLGVAGDEGYILTVSTLEPRKNLARLTQAYARARARLGAPLPLVVVGPQGWGPTLPPSDHVVLAGAVTGATLAGLYSGARLLVSVPLREGFGLPPVEAMLLGTPVVASPMPSTAGAAHEVSPLDVDEIAEGLVLVATDDRIRARLVTAGRQRAAHLTWRRAALRHVELWEALVR